MRRLYAAIFREMTETAVQGAAQPYEEFREQRRGKRIPSDDQALALQVKNSSSTLLQLALPQVQTPNCYAPLRNGMEVEERQDTTGTHAEKQFTSSQAGRPPPITLKSATNLIQLQKKIRGPFKGSLEFRNTRRGTRVVTKPLFQTENLSFFTFHPKSLKPIKAVIRHLPSVIPAKEIYEALAELGFDVMSVKQMTSSRRALILEQQSFKPFRRETTEFV
jgi:hypothetical protein